MTNIATKFLRQKAVYWKVESRINIHGEKLFEDPVEIPVRWSDEKDEFIDENGERKVSKAKVMVDRDMGLGGFLMLGRRTDAENLDSPIESGALRIRGFNRIPSLDASVTVRVAYL